MVDITRIERIINRWDVRFVQRIFTGAEADYCGSSPRPAVHYAGRFAAKEAFMKALGIGLHQGVRFVDIEVTRGERGRPDLRLYGKAATLAEEKGLKAFHLSISHTDLYAVAMVIAGS